MALLSFFFLLIMLTVRGVGEGGVATKIRYRQELGGAHTLPISSKEFARKSAQHH